MRTWTFTMKVRLEDGDHLADGLPAWFKWFREDFSSIIPVLEILEISEPEEEMNEMANAPKP